MNFNVQKLFFPLILKIFFLKISNKTSQVEPFIEIRVFFKIKIASKDRGKSIFSSQNPSSLIQFEW